MNYRTLNKSEYSDWDKFVDSSPQGSIYSKSYYLKSIGCPFKIGIVEDSANIIAGIVLSKNEVGVYSNPLFVKYLGILYSGGSISKKRGNDKYKIDRIIIKNLPHFSIWSYYFHPKYDNWLNFYWNAYEQTTQYTYQIDFSESPDFRKNYLEKVKSPIRTALHNELIIDDISIDNFITVNKKSYTAKKRKPPYSDKKLKILLRSLSDSNSIYFKCVKDKNDNIHSVAAVAYDKKTANLILNGTDHGFAKFGGNTYLIDHMIKFASQNSKLFDFEGSMHERIEKFYRGFGANLTPYFLIYKNNVPTKIYQGILSFIKRWYL